MADFSNYELGQNVAELSEALIPDMANVFEIEVSPEPTADQLGLLVGAIGEKKTLRENEKGAKAWLTEFTGSEEGALALAAEWMNRSGVQNTLDRSLWTPELKTPPDAAIVITGAVANWQDRVTNLLIDRLNPDAWNEVFIPVGNRVMGTETEKLNPNIQRFLEAEGRYPTEAEYAKVVVAAELDPAGYRVEIASYDTKDGTEIAQRFVGDFTSLIMSGNIALARVANAGIQLACQFREAGRDEAIWYDSEDQPQVFVLTDSFPIAQTLEEAAPSNAKDFQNPFTGIRQIALTGKLLVEAASS